MLTFDTHSRRMNSKAADKQLMNKFNFFFCLENSGLAVLQSHLYGSTCKLGVKHIRAYKWLRHMVVVVAAE